MTGPHQTPGFRIMPRLGASAEISSSVLLERRQSATEPSRHPTASAKSVPWALASAPEKYRASEQAPLSMIAPAKRPRLFGEASWEQTLQAPAEQPKMVTLAGSPPKAAMFCCTQVRAAR
jgi:hypothetical protein